ncbi:transporter [Burkholderia sp. Bp8963]|uniref:transporter n=1 Tax=Burkholderia sp. Bp8963 TaxID=2184547 RepID=UPI000F591595|nr:transporter [Burkholderia sp. Bp8963]RQS55177.1 transporter [Burkholderia sp. Bp8963]
MADLLKTFLGLSATVALSLATSSPVFAIDYQPFDWVPLPAGQDVFMGYYEFAVHSEFNNVISGTAKGATSLNTNIGVARYLHYGLLGGHPYVLDFILPFGALTNGRIAGTHLNDASGIGDPIASIGYWLVNDPANKRYISAAIFVTLPVGTYDPKKSLNLGSNRWQTDLQLDYTQGLSDRFTIDVSGVWTYYGDNSDAGPGHQTLSQRSTYAAYVWLSYDVTPELVRN